MDTPYKNLLICIAAALMANLMIAQEKVSKTISETFEMTNAGELQLDNKYGNITIHGWSKNNISVTVDITTSHKKRENAQNLLDRIEPNIKTMSDFVTISSEIAEKNKGFFAEYFNKANPFDFDRSNVQINYSIYLPANAVVDITNKFGDVILEDWTGKLKIDVQHGDIWINKNLKNADIALKYGKLRAKNINFGSINLKNGSLSLGKSKDLRLTSSGSVMDLEEISMLEIYSSKDEITIDEVGAIHGELEFSNVELANVDDEIDLMMKIAEFNVLTIHSADAKIRIQQQSSEIVLNIHDFSFQFKATLEEGLLRLPKSFEKVETKMLDKGKRIREIKATYGNSKQGSVSITGEKGVILLKDLQ
ncbi:hypothetical protein [Arenibacter sp. F20364]|uniref:hypothetical protein n=1 Tax=Arenibacter sp. F20364 TaxID=2926415 RepID=UPI001FF1B3CA|nr:hypothetical protein [Arenibacter sp. F20364]MCK0192083.1 hypothetical protein [Arenibacter sp. F20364]